VRAAGPEPAVLDVAPDQHARLSAQAIKFSLGELSRILSLLVEAQTDLRWTTSPRLTLELALIRGAVPAADPHTAGLAARVERLERLAGVVERTVGANEVAPAETPATNQGAEEAHEAGEWPPDELVAEHHAQESGHHGPHAPDTGALDMAAIRRS